MLTLPTRFLLVLLLLYCCQKKIQHCVNRFWFPFFEIVDSLEFIFFLIINSIFKKVGSLNLWKQAIIFWKVNNLCQIKYFCWKKSCDKMQPTYIYLLELINLLLICLTFIYLFIDRGWCFDRWNKGRIWIGNATLLGSWPFLKKIYINKK